MARIISRASVRLDTDATGLSATINRAVKRAAANAQGTVHLDVDMSNIERALDRLRRRSGGLLNTLFSGKLIGAAASAMRDYGAAILAVAPAAASLGVELATALQSLAILPGVAAAGAATIATLVIGVQGLDEAFKNMDNLDKFNKALEDLAPNARAFARTIRDLREPFKQLRLGVQQELFDGVAKSVRNLADSAMPTLRTGLEGIASELSDGFNLWAEYAASAEGVRNLETILGNTEKAMNKLGPAGTDFAAALADIAAVGSSFLEPLSDSLGRAASQFRDFIAEAEKSGKLKQFMQEGLDAVEQLFNTLMALGRVIGTIFTGIAGEGQGFLRTLELGAESLNRFLKSAEGQEALQALGDVMRAVGQMMRDVFGAALRELGPVLIELTPFILELAEHVGGLLVAAIEVVAPLLKMLATFLSENKDLLAPMVAGFLVVAKVLGIVAPAFRFLVTIIGFVIRHWKLLSLALRLSPWGIVISAVILVATVIFKNWNAIKNFMIKVWNTIRAVGTVIWSNLRNTFNNVTHNIRATFFRVWNSIKDFFVNTWNSIFNTTRNAFRNVLDFIRNTLNNIRNFFSNAWDAVTRITANAWSALTNAVNRGINAAVNLVSRLPGLFIASFRELPMMLFNIGRDILQGLINGISSIVGAVISKAKEIGGQILGGVKSALGIGSPSKEMAKLGEFAGQGLIQGLERIGPRVDRAAGELGATVTNAAQRRLKLTGPDGLMAGRDIGGDGAAAPAATFQQTNIMQPGTDVRQFANTVLQRGMTGYRSGGGTRAVSRQGVQAGVNDQRIEGVRL